MCVDSCTHFIWHGIITGPVFRIDIRYCARSRGKAGNKGEIKNALPRTKNVGSQYVRRQRVPFDTSDMRLADSGGPTTISAQVSSTNGFDAPETTMLGRNLEVMHGEHVCRDEEEIRRHILSMTRTR